MKFDCPNCARRLEIPDELAAQPLTCPVCHAAISAPRLPASGSGATTPPAALSRGRPPSPIGQTRRPTSRAAATKGSAGRTIFTLLIFAAILFAAYHFRAEMTPYLRQAAGIASADINSFLAAATPTPPTAAQPAPRNVAIPESSPVAPAPAAAGPDLSDTAAPSLSIMVDHPITVFKDAASTRVSLQAAPAHFAPATYHWAQVPDRINVCATSGTVTFSVNNTAAPSTNVTFSTYGVYQIQLTASDGRRTVTRNTWVNVWDSATVFVGGNRLGLNPGISPPPSVRTLSATPPAYEHPRLLFTNADWPEMHQRDTNTGKWAQWGISSIRSQVAETLDNPKDDMGKFAAALAAWVNGGMTGPRPDGTLLGKTNIMASESRGCFYSTLLEAAYLGWIENDPAQPAPAEAAERGRYLARLAAGAARLHFDALWDRTTGQFHLDASTLKLDGFNTPGKPASGPDLCDLAMAYDLLYQWMDDGQRRSVRDFLFAAGWGRHSSHGWEDQPGPNDGKMRLGINQNGDFGNLNDQTIIEALAIEGEEQSVSPEVRAAFTAKPGSVEARWMRMADPADPAGWPAATVASIDNLERQSSWILEWFVTPWGLASNHLAYLGFTAKNMLPSTFALARRGENLWVTTNLYQTALHAMLVLHDAEGERTSKTGLASTKLQMFDHHDSGSFGQRGTMCILWKYLFPDDPLIDYVWRAYLPEQDRDPLLMAMFGIDPSYGVPAQTLEEVAKAAHLPLTVYDPQRGIVAMHSSWTQGETSMWFDCCGSDPYAGHMHAERNSFDFFALGRSWSIAPGYHVTISDLQSAVLVRDPRYVDDPVSHGFIGESASSATQRPGFPGNHPTPPGKMLEVTQSPDQLYTLVAGDATMAYTAAYGHNDIDTKLPFSSFVSPELLDVFYARRPEYRSYFAQTLKVATLDYNPMRYVIRSILFVRGPRPYALIVDDCDKNDQPQDWRWTMNDCEGFAPGQSPAFIGPDGKWAPTSLVIQPGATPADAVVYHSPIDDEQRPGQTGLPRLLVRDVGLTQYAGVPQPPIILERRTPENGFTYGVDNNSKKAVRLDSNCLLIERDRVVAPNYKVLLFPYRTGEATPVTAWNAGRTRLTIDIGEGIVDTIGFDQTHPDRRTRITFSRTGATPPGS